MSSKLDELDAELLDISWVYEEDEPPVDLLTLEPEYSGEAPDRAKLTAMMAGWSERHKKDLDSLAELRASHDLIASEMTRDLSTRTTVWDHVKGMMTEDFSTHFRELLERMPLISDVKSERPLSELLREKIETAERRTREVGQFLTTIEGNIRKLEEDIERLNKKVVVAAENEEKAAKRVLELRALEKRLGDEMARIGDERSAEARKLQADIDRTRRSIWQTGAKLRLYSQTEDRIASIVRMNNNFLEILTHLHGDMQHLHEAGHDALDDLRGNLTGLTAAAQATELSMEMNEAMQDLKQGVNKIAVLASNTALYLSQNVERMAEEMKIYDEAAADMVEDNLRAQREMHENRINDTLALAQREYGLMRDARRDES